MMRSALTLTCMLGMACADDGWPGDDPPDPIYPANGWWQVVEREIREIDCQNANFGASQFVWDVWVRVVDERLHMGWGTYGAWAVRGARCPVNQYGAFFCPPVFRERVFSDYDIATHSEILIRGGNRGDDSPMTFIYHRKTKCTGEDCGIPYCEYEEVSQLVYRGSERPPGF